MYLLKKIAFSFTSVDKNRNARRLKIKPWRNSLLMGVTLPSKSHNYEHVNTKEIFSRKSHFREKKENFFSLSIVSDKKLCSFDIFWRVRKKYFRRFFQKQRCFDISGLTKSKTSKLKYTKECLIFNGFINRAL